MGMGFFCSSFMSPSSWMHSLAMPCSSANQSWRLMAAKPLAMLSTSTYLDTKASVDVSGTGGKGSMEAGVSRVEGGDLVLLLLALGEGHPLAAQRHGERPRVAVVLDHRI
ncbi:hypothetical protein ABZP36_025179 [Zizania latifolia]